MFSFIISINDEVTLKSVSRMKLVFFLLKFPLSQTAKGAQVGLSCNVYCTTLVLSYIIVFWCLLTACSLQDLYGKCRLHLWD